MNRNQTDWPQYPITFITIWSFSLASTYCSPMSETSDIEMQFHDEGLDFDEV